MGARGRCTFPDWLRTVLMAGKSKRNTRTAHAAVGDITSETSGSTVEGNGPAAASAETDRGRKRSSGKTTRRAAGKPRTKTNRRAARSATTARSAPRGQPAARELDRQTRTLEKETKAVHKSLDGARRRVEEIRTRAEDLARQMKDSARQWQEARRQADKVGGQV